MRRGVAACWGTALVGSLMSCEGEAAGPWDGVPNADLAVRWSVADGELPTSAALLEPVALHLHLYRAQGVAVEFVPQVPEGFVGEFVAEGARPLGEGEHLSWAATLRPTGLGEVVLPAVEIRAGDLIAQTAPIPLQVTSRLPEDDAGALENASDLVPLPQPTWPYWAGAGALVGLGVLLWWMRRRAGRTRPMGDGVRVPAHIQAQRALAALRGAPRRTQAEVEVFYVGVSQILRDYIERRFGVAAPDRTTEEFLAEADAHPALGGEPGRALGQFLQACDLVKFAGHVPPSDAHERVLAEAERFVEATREDREVAAEAGEGGR